LHDTIIWNKLSPNFPDENRYGQVFEFMFVLSKGAPKTINLISDRVNKYAGTKIHGTKRSVDGSIKKNDSKTEIPPNGARFNIWNIPNKPPSGSKHPAPFPEALARDHIISWSNPGDIVLDPFIGSGTTAKMAKETGRHWIGIDISDEYCELAKRRVAGANVPLFTL